LYDDRRVFSGIGLFFVYDLAEVKPVLEDQIKRSAGEFLAPIFGAIGPQPPLALDPGIRKRIPKGVHGFEREIALKNIDNDAGLGFIDDELAVFDVVAQGRDAAQIHKPFFFDAATLSRTLSLMTSRPNWAKDKSTFRVGRPMLVVVLNWWVIETKETPRWSKTSTS
jgi:hypothetical protein